ncbi:MAG TPA: NAD(P)-binding domain-containing protein, partial [Nocardioidaceae bacterium]|nr:NAD(P)-binding domain-containing protein [Nocardioidaceae bacterium]
MRIAVVGTGMVGRTIAPALAALGHDVVVGTRDPGTTAARDDWTLDLPLRPYSDVAEGADLVVNAT